MAAQVDLDSCQVRNRVWTKQSLKVGRTLAACFEAHKGGIPVEEITTVVDKAQKDGWLIGIKNPETIAKWVKETVLHFVQSCNSSIRHAAQFSVYLQDELEFLVQDHSRSVQVDVQEPCCMHKFSTFMQIWTIFPGS